MRKILAALIIILVSSNAFSGQVGLPTERLALPPTTAGNYLVCIWNESVGQWESGFEVYDKSGSYNFTVPSWNNWYWIGLWDESAGKYVYGKWVGHFLTN